MNKKKLAVILPGTGYTPFMPLLFYAANSAEEKGYDICWVDYCPIFAEAKPRGADGMNAALEKAFQYAEEKLDAIRYDEYETVVFIGKSLGTIVGAKYAAQHNCTPDQVWYTPVPEAYEYVKGNVLAFMGDRDHVMNAEEARKKAAEKNLPLHVYPNADHSLATGNTLTDLDILKDVMTVTGDFLK